MQDLVSGQIDMSILDPVTSPAAASRRPHQGARRDGEKPHRATRPTFRPWTRPASPGVYIKPWQAIWAPKGTPKDIIAKLNGAVVKTLGDPAVRAKLAEQSYEVGPREEQTPEYLGAFHKAEVEKWWPIIKAAGIKGG